MFRERKLPDTCSGRLAATCAVAVVTDEKKEPRPMNSIYPQCQWDRIAYWHRARALSLAVKGAGKKDDKVRYRPFSGLDKK